MKNFLALLLFVGGFGAWYLHHYTKKTTTRVQEVSEQIKNLETKIAAQQAEFTTITDALEMQKKADATRKALAIINDRQKALAQQRSALAQNRQKSITSGRQSLVGVVLTDVTLADGRKLGQVRIMKVDDGGVSLAVPSGVLRVTPRELTPELREYFRF